MNEDDKAAFLDGYQAGMKRSHLRNQVLCKVLKDGVKSSSDTQAFNNYVVAVISVCEQSSQFEGFEKITSKDLDGFYSERANEPIQAEWALEYLRDKASGKKTEGQLLDDLKAEQKDVHDCSKYPNLYVCKPDSKEFHLPQ